jgi:hypothetical protein
MILTLTKKSTKNHLYAKFVTIKTTYEHIAKRIGEAVHKAYKGKLELHYQEGAHFLRVKWHRD